NDISHNSVAGLYADCAFAGACPSGCFPLYVRGNYIHNNQTGVYIRRTTTVDLGTASDLGYNNISSNTAYCLRDASTCSPLIQAQGNYIGGCDPLPQCFTPGSFELSNLLCSPPVGCGGSPIVASTPAVPTRTAIVGIHPNPFNPQTTVAFDL